MRIVKPWWMMLLTLALSLLSTIVSPSMGWGQPKYGGPWSWPTMIQTS
jgi:hypothetical protein